MFPLRFRGVFIRSTAVTRAPADSPQLFKEIWMPGLKQGRAQEKRGRQKEDKEGKKRRARAAGRDASTSRGMARVEWRTGWIRREGEAGTEGGGQESNKHRVPFLPFKARLPAFHAWPPAQKEKVTSSFERWLCEVCDWREAVCKCHGSKKRMERWKDKTAAEDSNASLSRSDGTLKGQLTPLLWQALIP